MTVKNVFKFNFFLKSNVHLVTQLSCVFKTLTKTNVNKENHTLDLTEIMQYGLLIKQFINLYIKLPSCLCNNCARFTKPSIKMKGAVQASIIYFYYQALFSLSLLDYKGNKSLLIKVHKQVCTWMCRSWNGTRRGQLNANCCKEKQQFLGINKMCHIFKGAPPIVLTFNISRSNSF